ncbi:MAG: prohibitin family protein [Candidatus Dojkabacteria bacterium]|nr:MAG: prohibitin family protein [Candidatus Dojkabacteria bacterium]
MKTTSKIGGFIGLVMAVFVLVVVVALMSTTQIQFGTTGVITRFGALTDRTLQPGLHFKIPFVDDVVVYRTQKIIYETSDNPRTSEADYTDFPVETTSKDGQAVSIRYSVRFSIDPTKVQTVASTLGRENEVIEKVVKTDSRIFARNVPRGFTAEELYSGNVQDVEQEIVELLRPSFEKNGLILDEFGIRGITFSQDYQATIESKQIEKEKINIEEYKAQQEEFRKQQKITQAQADAEAQRLQQQTLSKELIQKLYIEKWNGTLPQVVNGGQSPLLIDLGSGLFK